MQVRVLFISGFAAGSLRGSGGLVVAAGFESRVAEEFVGGGVDDAGLKVLDEQDDAGSIVEDGRGDRLGLEQSEDGVMSAPQIAPST
jgi:hypothetical protein